MRLAGTGGNALRGANPPEGYFILIGQLATTYYFLHFLIIMPFVGWFETPRQLPESIASSVLEKGRGGAVGKEAV